MTGRSSPLTGYMPRVTNLSLPAMAFPLEAVAVFPVRSARVLPSGSQHSQNPSATAASQMPDSPGKFFGSSRNRQKCRAFQALLHFREFLLRNQEHGEKCKKPGTTGVETPGRPSRPSPPRYVSQKTGPFPERVRRDDFLGLPISNRRSHDALRAAGASAERMGGLRFVSRHEQEQSPAGAILSVGLALLTNMHPAAHSLSNKLPRSPLLPLTLPVLVHRRGRAARRPSAPRRTRLASRSCGSRCSPADRWCHRHRPRPPCGPSRGRP